MTLQDVLTHFDGVKRCNAGQYMAKCPCHDDRKQSLSIGQGEKGVVMKCQAGCETKDILERVGLKFSDLAPAAAPAPAPTGKPQIVAVYQYPSGVQKLRKSDKSFTWRQPDGAGGWIYNRQSVPHSLYVAGKIAATVNVCEGEKDADNLHKLGANAVSGEDGAGHGKWRPEYTAQLRGCDVRIFQDNDDVGKAYAQETAAALHGTAAAVRVLDLSRIWADIPEHGDVSDLIAHFGASKAVQMIADLIKTTPVWTGPEAASKPVLMVQTAKDLMHKQLPPVRYIVNGLLSQGLALIVSPPKYGKSWMMLDLCIAVAAGVDFLGYSTNKSGCLYLALEDPERRLQTRLRLILNGDEVPDGFDYATAAARLDDGLIDMLQGYVDQHPGAGLIIIDTLEKIRSGVQGRESAYSADYREMGILKTFADKNNLCVLLVHHLRKMNDDSDPFNRISGTNGIMGAADTAIVLTRQARNDADTLLSVTGRDVESSESVIHFDKETHRWKNIGEAAEMWAAREREAYENNPLVLTIKTLIRQSGGHWEGSSKDLIAAQKILHPVPVTPTPQKMGNDIRKYAPLLLQYDGIKYEYTKFRRQHHFYKHDPPPEMEQATLQEVCPHTENVMNVMERDADSSSVTAHNVHDVHDVHSEECTKEAD